MQKGLQPENHTEDGGPAESNVPHSSIQEDPNFQKVGPPTTMLAQYNGKKVSGAGLDHNKQRLEKLISDSNNRRTRYQRDQGGVAQSQTQEVISPNPAPVVSKNPVKPAKQFESTSQILSSRVNNDQKAVITGEAERPRQMSEMNDNLNEQ